jgi:hypothetical protein
MSRFKLLVTAFAALLLHLRRPLKRLLYHHRAEGRFLYISVPHQMNLGFLEKYLLCHGEVFRRDSWPRIWSDEVLLLDCPATAHD